MFSSSNISLPLSLPPSIFLTPVFPLPFSVFSPCAHPLTLKHPLSPWFWCIAVAPPPHRRHNSLGKRGLPLPHASWSLSIALSLCCSHITHSSLHYFILASVFPSPSFTQGVSSMRQSIGKKLKSYPFPYQNTA